MKYLNQNGDIGEVLIFVFLLLLIGFMIFALISFVNASNNAPCSELGGWSAKDIPARCVQYYKDAK